MFLKTAVYSLSGQSEFCLIFIFSKIKKDFQSGALLKKSLSSPSMEEFGLVFRNKYISLKKVKAYLSKNNKNALNNAGFKGNFKYKEAVCLTEYSL